jgi:hypothetical protein
MVGRSEGQGRNDVQLRYVTPSRAAKAWLSLILNVRGGTKAAGGEGFVILVNSGLVTGGLCEPWCSRGTEEESVAPPEITRAGLRGEMRKASRE